MGTTEEMPPPPPMNPQQAFVGISGQQNEPISNVSSAKGRPFAGSKRYTNPGFF